MADNEKLVFQIGFDLDSAVKDATSEWKRVQRELEAAINARPISISMDTRGLERFNTFVERTYASLEDLQDLFPEVFKETKDGEGITKRFQAMETSINAVSKEMRNLEKVWNNLSQAEKFDDDGNLTERAQELKRAYVELYQSQKTQGQTLQEITKEAINLANQEYEAQQRKKKQEEDFIRLLNLEETTLEKLQAKQGAWKQKLSQTEIGSSDWSNAIAEVQRLETKMKDLQKQIKGVATESKKTSKTKVYIDTSTFAGKLKDLENRWKALNAEQRKGAEGQALRAEWRKLSEEAGRYTSTLRSAVSAEDRLANAKKKNTQATHEQNTAYKTQSTYLSRLVQRMVAYASVTQAFSFIRNIREVTAQFELQRVALGSIIGDLNEANAMFEQIKAAAVKSPFQIKELVTYTKQLAAYKIETDELFETTQRLADISAGIGVGMERLVLAYGQIRATGYLRASEVRQLTEAGIPIVEELAKKMSDLRGETVSAAEVMGLISERAISFGVVKEVFDDMTSAGGMFYKMQEKQAETLAGQWSNLQDAISIMYEEIGNTEGVNNSIKGTIGLVKSLAENWRIVASVLGSVAISIGTTKLASLFIPTLVVNTKKVAQAEEQLRIATERRIAAQQRGGRVGIWVAKSQEEAARATLNAANATTKFGRAWSMLKGMFKGGGWIGLAVTLVSALVTWFISARKEAKRLNEELAKIGTEGALQADQSVRNFERLAKAIRESADGSGKQTEALKELKRSYGDLLPEQDKEIKALVQEKSNYDELIKSIRRKIELQIQEQKLSKIISEYSNRIDKKEDNLTDWLTGKDWRSVEKFTEQQASDITFAIRQAVSEGLITAEDDWKTVAGKLTKIINETTLKKSWFGVDTMYGVNRDMYEEYVNTILDMYRQIDKVGGALDKMDDKGKNLSDTFNTWQKELEAINEGTNDLGGNSRIFDDTTILQITKITDATSRVADEYKRLAKEKERVDKALLSEGAKADSKTYVQLEKRLGRINTAMSMLYNFLEKYGGLDLLEEGRSGGGKKTNPRIALLNEELSTVEKIYKEYQELRKFMSEADARARVADMFEGVNLTMLSQALSPTEMRAQLQKALDEAKKMGDKKQILELEYKLGKFDVDEAQRKLEEDLKKLSDDLSRTKTAKEFFDRMLGLTGDKQLSASLTVSIYGGEMGDDLGERLAKDMATKFQEQVQTYFGDIDISSAINEATGDIDPIKLEKLLTEENVKKMGKDNVIEVRKIINDLIKANADYTTELFKSYEKFFDYEKRMTMVTQREEEERKKIRESMMSDEQKTQLEEASKKREQEQISAIEIEQLKDTADWEKTFENLNNLGSLTIKNLISLLEDYIAKKKVAGEPIAESDMKTLMNELNQLREKNAQLDPFATIKASLKDLTDATKEYNKAKKDGDEEGMADAQNKRAKALNDLETSVNAVASGFQNLSNLLTEFQELLGIEDDSAMGEVFNGAAKALGVVATALSTAIALTLLWNSTLWSNPLFTGVAIASGVLGAIAGVFSAISNAKVRKANKEIERQQELLDSLAYSYERLEKAQEKAFGGDYISNYQNQLENLEAQQEAYLKQADAERSKGKKADEDKIKEYEEQARDTADAIKDMQSELSEYFLGTDLTSSARDFANAWIEAYKEFGSTTDAMKEKFQDMIQNMIVESFAAKVIQTALSDIFTEIDNMTKDGVLDISEASKIADMTEVAVGNIDVGMTNLMNALSQAGLSVRGMGSNLTGISRDIATASEESILGLATGINTQNFYISQVPPKLDVIIGLLQGDNLAQGSAITLQDLVTIQNQYLMQLPTIAQHTAETVAECKQIVAETRRTADALERVIKPDGTRTTYKMNVVTSYQG